MSYCRFASAETVAKFAGGEYGPDEPSDVYVYLDCGGWLACCACRIEGMSGRWEHYSTDAMIAHLRAHIAAGHTVPADVIPALEADRAENDAFIAA
jgi:hypothetical protein